MFIIILYSTNFSVEWEEYTGGFINRTKIRTSYVGLRYDLIKWLNETLYFFTYKTLGPLDQLNLQNVFCKHNFRSVVYVSY